MIKPAIFVVCGIIGYSLYTGVSITDIVDTSQHVVHIIATNVADATD